MPTATLGLQKQGQSSFALGAFPGLENIPPNGAEDLVNAVIADDGTLFRRGGSTYFGTLTATDQRPFRNLWSGSLGNIGPITLVSRSQGTTVVSEGFQALMPGASDFVQVFTDDTPTQRASAIAGMVVFVSNPVGALGANTVTWGGYSGALPGLTGTTVSFTADSPTVTGSGFSGTVGAGMIINGHATMSDRQAVVATVISNTELRLLERWRGPTQTGPVNISSAVSSTVVMENLTVAQGTERTYSSVIFDRLLIARGARIAFTSGPDPIVTSTTDYHELPAGATILGMEPLRSQLVVFSTDGIYAIDNLAYDLTDAFGNVQQRLEHAGPDVVLWDDLGVSAWRGLVVAPCVDDIYLLSSASDIKPIAGGMRSLYRSYVQQGFVPGMAHVFNGRYVLPVFSGTTWVDTLVCDLRSGAWTRWNGTAAAVKAIASVVGSSSRQPKVFALGAEGSSRRVLELTHVLDESGSSTDADGSSYDVQITTRTLTAPGLLSQLWRRFRARFETEDSVQVELEVASGRPGAEFENVNGEQVESAAGEQVWTWPLSLRARAVRFRLTVTSSTREVLRAFEVFSRPSGKP